MTRNPAKVLSASRRTDIPAFYLDWFMDGIKNRFFTVENPYNRQQRNIDLEAENIRAIVFWSKNFAPFLASGAGRTLQEMGYHLFFNFTLNSPNPLLEPNLPGLSERLDQMSLLAKTYGPDAVSWRFDPICFYRLAPDTPRQNNLEKFETIAAQAAESGLASCSTSFFDPYPKIARRIRRLSKKQRDLAGLEMVDPSAETKTDLIRRMADLLEKKGIRLHLCCENALIDTGAPPGQVTSSACIDGKKISRVSGLEFESRRDYGQRSKLGCRCTRAIDIGSYRAHPCPHNCLFCYASPEMDTRTKETPQ